MTRLRPSDLRGIPADLPRYDGELHRRLGCGLRGLACRAAGIAEERFAALAGGLIARVVPMDCGQGVLGGFAEAVCAVAGHLGFRAAATSASDACGLAEAYEAGADLLLLADDRRFVAVHTGTRRVADNAEATGRGFAAGLELMAGGLDDRPVLLIGCGRVGRAAARFLLGRGARLAAFDLRGERAEALAAELAAEAGSGGTGRAGRPAHPARPVRVERDLEEAVRRHDLLLNASPAGAFLREDWITSATVLSAPGVPLGLTAAAMGRIGARLLHDPLQTGVAAMLAEAVRP